MEVAAAELPKAGGVVARGTVRSLARGSVKELKGSRVGDGGEEGL